MFVRMMNQSILSGLAMKQKEVILWPALQKEQNESTSTISFYEQIENKTIINKNKLI